MSLTRTGPALSSAGPATNTLISAEGSASLPPWGTWREHTDWWLDPRLAYAAGLADGVDLERRRREPEDDVVHRQAVRHAVQLIERADRRRRFDRGEVTR